MAISTLKEILFSFSYFLKDFIYLFERERDRDSERENMSGEEREKQPPHFK